jgi:hypothetical protein
MKIINIDGGLGNQMFKYAFALVLKQEHPNQKILIDSRLCRWRRPKTHTGYELNRLFNLELTEASIWQIFIVSKRAFGIILYKINKKLYSNYLSYFYDKKDVNYIEDYSALSIFNKDLLLNKESLYYDVSVQSWQYYAKYREILLKAFTFKESIDFDNENIVNEMRGCNSVAIHFRFGDYLKLKEFNVCTKDYYQIALNYINSKFSLLNYYIFTNDIEYFNTEFRDSLDFRGGNIKIINKNQETDSYKDLILMNNCKCLILANSSFSWWGAWLNNRSDSVCVAPKRWFLTSEFPDICPPNWVRI